MKKCLRCLLLMYIILLVCLRDAAAQQAIANNSITKPTVTSVCANDDPAPITGSLPKGGSGTFSYQWQSSADNTNFSDITTNGKAIDYDPPVLSATTYFRRNVTSGPNDPLSTSNVVKITVLSTPADPILFVSIQPPLCQGSTDVISISNSQPGVTYNWYDSQAKTNLLFTGINYKTKPLNATQTFYVQGTNGTCTSNLRSIQIGVLQAPATPQLIKNPVSACSGSTAKLSIANPQPDLVYKWYATATGTTPIFTGPDFVTPVLKANATYYVAGDNGCPSTNRATVNVVVNPLPDIQATNAAICPNTSTTVTASSSDPDVTINWYASPTSANILFTGSLFPTPVLNANTAYYAEAVNTVTGCVSATRSPAQVQILQPLPAPDVTVSSVTVTSVTFGWAAVPGAIAYKVSIDNGQTFTDPSSGTNGLAHTVDGLQLQQSVTLVVRALGNYDCQLGVISAPVTGTAESPLGDQIFVANAFTPNGDGKNDFIYVRGPNIKSVKFYVYDQYGELLYLSENVDKGWDGSYKGKKEPVGVYVYYLEAIMMDGKQVSKKGTITLLR